MGLFAGGSLESRPHKLQGVAQQLPEYPPSSEASQLIYDGFLHNYRRFEHWQMQKRQQSFRAKLLSTAKGVFAITRKPPKDTLDCLEDREDQKVTVIDAMQGLVEVPRPFKSCALIIHWTLQDQPVTVVPVAQSTTQFQVTSDLLYGNGQTLSCKTLVHDEGEIHNRLAELWSPRWTRHADPSQPLKQHLPVC